jgi:hypothetical protein
MSASSITMPPLPETGHGLLDLGPLRPADRMLEGLGDRGQMLRTARADHDLGHPVVGQQPAEREPGHRGAAARGDRPQPIQCLEGRAGDELLVPLGPLGHPRPGRVRRAAAVLAGEPAARQRAERQVGDA